MAVVISLHSQATPIGDLLLAAALGGASCAGERGEAVSPVTGKVTTPLAGAVVRAPGPMIRDEPARLRLEAPRTRHKQRGRPMGGLVECPRREG